MLGALLISGVIMATPDDCRETYAAVRYREAAAACLEAIPQTSPEQLAGIYRLAALSLAAIGDEDRADAMFTSLLALDPQAELSSSISPKLRVLFDRARKKGVTSVLMSARATAAAREDQPVHVEVSVEDGAPHLVQRLTAVANGVRVQAARQGVLTSLDLPPPGRPGPWTASFTGEDRFGGRLGSTALQLDVAPLHPPRPAWLSWKVWGVSAAVVAIGAVVAGLYSKQTYAAAQRDVFADAAMADLRRAQTSAYVADTAFGAAGALAIGAGVLLLTEPTP